MALRECSKWGDLVVSILCSFLTFLLIFGGLPSFVLDAVVVEVLGKAAHNANKLCLSSQRKVGPDDVIAVSIAAWIMRW